MKKPNLDSTPIGHIWKQIGIKPHYGINLPLFAIHTQQSCGIGEFLDLKILIDWAQKIGFDVIQLLPLNDSGLDPSPYNALSSCALHPIYLSLHTLPYLNDYPKLKEELNSFLPLNQTKRISYQKVRNKKIIWLKNYYHSVGKKIVSTPSYQQFVQSNDWIHNYGLYKTLKEKYPGEGWQTWPKPLQIITPTHAKKLRKAYHDSISFYIFLQYLAFEQLSFIKQYASQKGVLLKGDIPILISPDSVDVWMNHSRFDTTLSVGSPPDIFNKEGQYWGFPVYNWKAMSEHDYGWWKRRLHYAENFYHLYRIDHILGFFRMWVIPTGKKAREGYFMPDREEVMILQGRVLLEQFITFSNMLPIGEDLGIIPKGMPAVLAEYGICGTKVFRWMKENSHFISYENYPPLSMSTVSTHDSETLDLWWRDRPEEAHPFAQHMGWSYKNKLSKEYRFKILYDNLHNPSLFHINLLQEYLALVPELTWKNPEDERINIPGYILPENWTYRYKSSLETITTNEEFATFMRKLLSE